MQHAYALTRHKAFLGNTTKQHYNKHVITLQLGIVIVLVPCVGVRQDDVRCSCELETVRNDLPFWM